MKPTIQPSLIGTTSKKPFLNLKSNILEGRELLYGTYTFAHEMEWTNFLNTWTIFRYVAISEIQQAWPATPSTRLAAALYQALLQSYQSAVSMATGPFHFSRFSSAISSLANTSKAEYVHRLMGVLAIHSTA